MRMRNLARNFISAFNLPVERGYLREIPPDGMSSLQYSEGYRMPLIGGVKSYHDSRNNGASVQDAFRDAVTVQYMTISTILIGGTIANIFLIPVD